MFSNRTARFLALLACAMNALAQGELVELRHLSVEFFKSMNYNDYTLPANLFKVAIARVRGLAPQLSSEDVRRLSLLQVLDRVEHYPAEPPNLLSKQENFVEVSVPSLGPNARIRVDPVFVVALLFTELTGSPVETVGKGQDERIKLRKEAWNSFQNFYNGCAWEWLELTKCEELLSQMERTFPRMARATLSLPTKQTASVAIERFYPHNDTGRLCEVTLDLVLPASAFSQVVIFGQSNSFVDQLCPREYKRDQPDSEGWGRCEERLRLGPRVPTLISDAGTLKKFNWTLSDRASRNPAKFGIVLRQDEDTVFKVQLVLWAREQDPIARLPRVYRSKSVVVGLLCSERASKEIR